MATSKRRYWYAAEWPYGLGAQDESSDAIVLWRFISRSARDKFVREGSDLFSPNYSCERTIYSGVAARKRACAFEMLPDNSDYQVVDQ